MPEPIDRNEDEGRGVSFREIIVALLRHRRIFLACTVAGAVALGIWSVVTPEAYVVSASFIPQGHEAESQAAASLRALLGEGTQSQSAQFYEDLLASRRVLIESARDTFEVAGQELTTAAILGVEAPTDSQRVRKIISRLRRDLMVTVAGTGIVSVQLTAPVPEGAEALLMRLIDVAEQFNIGMRQSRARTEREFLEQRLAEARSRLHEAEAALTAFLERNRGFTNSPELQVEYQRLQWQAQHHQRLMSDLASMYEEARVQEVRNTPVVTMLDGADGSARSASMDTGQWIVFGAALGALIGVLVVLAVHHLGWRVPDMSSVRVALRRATSAG